MTEQVREHGPFDATVKSIDGDKVTVTPDHHGSDMTLTVGESTNLYLDSKPTELASFRPGSVVRCVYDLNTSRLTFLATYVGIPRPPFLHPSAPR